MKRTNILLQIIPLFLALIIFAFTTNELIVSLLLLALIGATFAIHYEKDEWKLVLLGIVLGIAMELMGDSIYKAQYWENASFFGIPYWLPLLWGYAFVLIRRIGNLLVKSS